MIIMKKLIYPQLALLLLATAACSSDDTPALPQGAVTTVAATPDNVAIEAPAQSSTPQRAQFSGTMSYENGQTISYDLYTVAGTPIAFVSSLGGSSATVTVPATLTLKSGEQNVDFTVVGWNLNNYEGISEGIQTLRISGTARRWFSSTSANAMRAMTAEDWTGVMNQTSSLARIELGSGFTDFVSINGAIYTEDMETFVCCPRGREGEFVVANGVKTIGAYAFNECNKLTRIVLPASIELISDNAMLFDNSLLALDILAPKAPKAGEYAFGTFARDAKLRVPEGARQTYLVEEFTKNAPEMPEALLEITSPEAALRSNTKATTALYVEACNKYAGVVEDYNNVLAAYKSMMTYYNSDAMVNSDYVTRIENYVTVKNAYFVTLRAYQEAYAQYNTAVSAILPGDELDDTDVCANAYKGAQDKAATVNDLVKECNDLYKDSRTIYADRVATYEEELNNSEEYAGYKFFNPANITVINFEVK